jgi:hypothetical protein
MAKHPIQPLVKDAHGVVRFKANSIVDYLLSKGGIDMNMLAAQQFPAEDREQFAQLIGYSWSGANDLSYMSNDVLEAARTAYDEGTSPEATLANLRGEQLDALRKALRGPMAELFGVHPDNLGEAEEEEDAADATDGKA